MRTAASLAATLGLACLVALAALPAVAVPLVTRGVIVTAPADLAEVRAAFCDALLEGLSNREVGQAALLEPESALWKAGGLAGEAGQRLLSGPTEQCGPALLEAAGKLYLDELVRVTLAAGEQGGQAEVLWARRAVGQVRSSPQSVTQPLSANTAPLLAGKVLSLLLRGWDDAATVASVSVPPPIATVPQPVTPPVPPTTPTTPATPAAPTTPATPATPAPTTPAAPTTTAPTTPEAPTTPAVPATPTAPPTTPPPAAPVTPPAPSTTLQLARKAFSEGESARALELIAQALRSGEDRVTALLLRAEVYGALQNREGQREALVAVLATDQKLYEPRLMLAALELQRDLWQDAAKLCDQAIALRPQEPAAYLQAAEVYRQQRQAEKALDYLQAGVKANPESQMLLRALAQEYEKRGLLAQAEETWARLAAVATGAEKARALRRLGKMYTEAGQYAAAFGAYRQAAESDAAGAATSYAELFRACDQAVGAALERCVKVVGQMEQTGAGHLPREEAFEQVSAQVKSLAGLREFAQKAQVPAEQEKSHAQRLLYYSLALEAATDLQVYVDTGEAALREEAGQRRQEATEALRRLSPPG